MLKKYLGVLEKDWFWYRFEWQSRSAIHAHGVIKLKNDPGMIQLVTTVYAARQLQKMMEDDHELFSSKSEEEQEEIQQKIIEGYEAEKTVIRYVDFLTTTFNPRQNPGSPEDASVPDPHPCSKDISDILRDSAAMDGDYEEIVNCVQRHICRHNGYCRSKNDGKCRFNFPFDRQTETKLIFEKTGNSVKAKIVNKRNDEVMNVHNRTMLQFWRANVDFQIILDHHAAISYIAKYASKGEKAGTALQSIIKTTILKANSSDNTAKTLRSAIIKSIGNRDIGQGEASRILMSGHHCESSFQFTHVSLDLSVQKITKDREGNLTPEPTLLRMFGNRYEIDEQSPQYKILDHPNFLEFARHFKLVKGKLTAIPVNIVNKLIVVTFPNHRKCERHLPNYKLYCRSAFVKYADWTTQNIEEILNDDMIIEMWETFEANASEDIRRYFNTDNELQNRFKDVQYDLGEDEEDDNENLRTVSWQHASSMRPQNEVEGVPDTPTVNHTYDWHSNYKQYTRAQIEQAPQWISINRSDDEGPQGVRDLPNVQR